MNKTIILKNLFSFLLGGTAVRIISFFSIMLIARQIGEDSFGQYAPTLSNISLLSILFSLGIDNWLLYRASQQTADVARFISVGFLIKLGVGLIWVLGMYLLAPLFNQATMPTSLVLIAVSAVLFEQLAETLWTTFKINLQNHIYVLFLSLYNVGFFIAILILQATGSTDPHHYMLAKAGFAGGTLLLTALYFQSRHKFSFDRKLMWALLAGTKIFWLSFALSQMYARADLFIISQIMEKEATNVYALASTIINALFIFPLALYTVLLPIFTQYQTESIARFKQFLHRIGWATILGMVAGGLSMWITSPFIPLMFGEDFRESSVILKIFSLIFAIKIGTFVLAAVLVTTHQQHKRVWVQAPAVVFNLVGSFWAAKTGILTYVAWVYVATEVLVAVGYGAIFLNWWKTADEPETDSNR